MIPTLRTAGLLAIAGFLSLLLGPGWAGLVFVGVLIIAAVDGFGVRQPPGVTQQVPRLVSRGVPTALRVVAHAETGPLTIHQPTIPDLDLDEQTGAGGTLDTTMTAVRRGRHSLPAPTALRTGVLGLAATRHRVGVVSQVIVYPDMPAAYRLVTAVRHGRVSEDGSRRRGTPGLGTEFESIRDYQPDDDIRQVNWRATARTGRPMSNQFRLDQDREVIVVLDAGRLMAAPLGSATRLDAAVDAAAAVALVADEVGDRAGAVAFDQRVLRSVRPSRGGGEGVVRAIFDLEPSPFDSNYESAFAALGSSKRAFVLVLTDLVDLSAARSLIAGVPLLVRHHAVAIASVMDTATGALLTDPPETAVDTYRAAVAVEVRRERALVKQRLAHAGATVIDSPHRFFSARCVAAYLRAKSTARL